MGNHVYPSCIEGFREFLSCRSSDIPLEAILHVHRDPLDHGVRMLEDCIIMLIPRALPRIRAIKPRDPCPHLGKRGCPEAHVQGTWKTSKDALKQHENDKLRHACFGNLVARYCKNIPLARDTLALDTLEMKDEPMNMIGGNIETFGENGHVDHARSVLFKIHDSIRRPEILSSDPLNIRGRMLQRGGFIMAQIHIIDKHLWFRLIEHVVPLEVVLLPRELAWDDHARPVAELSFRVD
jgi:hypothetical protein